MLTSFTETRRLLAEMGARFDDQQLQALVEAIGQESSEEYYAYLDTLPAYEPPEGLEVEHDAGPEPELEIDS